MTDAPQTEREMRIRAEWEVNLTEASMQEIFDHDKYRHLLDLSDDELEWEFLAQKDAPRIISGLCLILYDHAKIQIRVKRVPVSDEVPDDDEEEVSPEEAETAGHPS